MSIDEGLFYVIRHTVEKKEHEAIRGCGMWLLTRRVLVQVAWRLRVAGAIQEEKPEYKESILNVVLLNRVYVAEPVDWRGIGGIVRVGMRLICVAWVLGLRGDMCHIEFDIELKIVFDFLSLPAARLRWFGTLFGAHLVAKVVDDLFHYRVAWLL